MQVQSTRPMRTKARNIVVAVLVTSTMMMAPGAAEAAGVYAFSGPNQSGFSCSWDRGVNDSNWDSCPPFGMNMHNNAESLYNRTFPGDANNRVNFYFHTGYGGAWACLGPGDYWGDLTLHIEHFNRRGSSSAGFGQPLDRNIGSHKWVPYCGAA
jgi:hypothetical protein